MLVAGGSTSVTTYFAMRLTADGKAATGLTITGFDLQYVRSGVAPSTKADATALVAADSSFAADKAIEIDATDQPGLYRVDWPDAAFAAGVREVILTVKVATAFTEHIRVELDGPVDAIWDEVLTGATHNVSNSAGRRLRQLQEAGGYALGRIWIDTVNGAAGTTAFENGTANNPVNSIADAKTLSADSTVNLSDFHVINGSTFTLAETTDNESYFGDNWTLVLGGQSIVASYFEGANVTGTGTGVGATFTDCSISTVTLAPCTAVMCRFGNTFTMGAAGEFVFIDCVAELVGANAPVLDFAAVGASTVNYRRYSGGLTVNNLASGDVLGIEVTSGGPITLNGTDATIALKGNINIVTDNTTSSTVITQGVVNQTTINTQADTAISDAFTFTNSNEVDANTKSINDAEVVGDGNATPWDGV